MTDDLRELVAREARVANLLPGLWAEAEIAEAWAGPVTIAEFKLADRILAIPRIQAALNDTAKLEAEIERWHNAYIIAHKQAMENGANLAELRAQFKDVAGLDD